MLEIKNLTAGYGPMVAVKGLSLCVPTASIVAILGANGAGKSTTLQSVAGHVPVWSGQIVYDGHDLTRMRAEARVHIGVAIAPEGRRLFTDLTVRENLVVGGYSRTKAKARANMDSVLDLFPRLAERINIRARLLSGGEQQMLAIGRALMADPSLLMIDEVSLGLMPKNVSMCYEAIEKLKDRGISILLVEQNVRRALQTVSYAYIIESGALVWSGPAASALSDARVAELYLGGA